MDGAPLLPDGEAGRKESRNHKRERRTDQSGRDSTTPGATKRSPEQKQDNNTANTESTFPDNTYGGSYIRVQGFAPIQSFPSQPFQRQPMPRVSDIYDMVA